MHATERTTDGADAVEFLDDPRRWNRQVAAEIAGRLGIAELSEPHWAIADYLRDHYLSNGTVPWEGNVCRDLDLPDGCIHRFFGGPIEAWKFAGLPDPGEEARTYMLNLEP